jgi:hypothetical protein
MRSVAIANEQNRFPRFVLPLNLRNKAFSEPIDSMIIVYPAIFGNGKPCSIM